MNFCRHDWAYLNERYTVNEAGCWIWVGTIDIGGYGRAVRDKKESKAHRLSYEMHRGPIPAGMFLDHLCRVRACINPDHLEPVTARENLLRGIGHPAINAAKTHCKRGHEFTPDNTYRAPNYPTRRMCKVCSKGARTRYFETHGFWNEPIQAKATLERHYAKRASGQ